MTAAPTDHRSHLRALADALTPGSAVPVPREWLLALLDGPASVAVPDLLANRWLTANQVAELLATPERWVYNHADQLGGKRLSRRCLRFSEAAVQRYLERRR